MRRIKIRRGNRYIPGKRTGNIEINSISSYGNGYSSAKHSNSIVSGSFRTDYLNKKVSQKLSFTLDIVLNTALLL